MRSRTFSSGYTSRRPLLHCQTYAFLSHRLLVCLFAHVLLSRRWRISAAGCVSIGPQGRLWSAEPRPSPNTLHRIDNDLPARGASRQHCRQVAGPNRCLSRTQKYASLLYGLLPVTARLTSYVYQPSSGNEGATCARWRFLLTASGPTPPSWTRIPLRRSNARELMRDPMPH
ncbi:hypothetical protein BD309DRAFT_652725 [Dichomitus squalens]|nr:hypothetical protein BD309DRAFT_652725 [Dichomitus squalens]